MDTDNNCDMCKTPVHENYGEICVMCGKYFCPKHLPKENHYCDGDENYEVALPVETGKRMAELLGGEEEEFPSMTLYAINYSADGQGSWLRSSNSRKKWAWADAPSVYTTERFARWLVKNHGGFLFKLTCAVAPTTNQDAVCSTCNDTHWMEAWDESGQKWPCTRCPTPCEQCRKGAYCKETPCSCRCHEIMVYKGIPQSAVQHIREEEREAIIKEYCLSAHGDTADEIRSGKHLRRR